MVTKKNVIFHVHTITEYRIVKSWTYFHFRYDQKYPQYCLSHNFRGGKSMHFFPEAKGHCYLEFKLHRVKTLFEPDLGSSYKKCVYYLGLL